MAILAADVAGYSRVIGGWPSLWRGPPASRLRWSNVSDGLVAHLGHICEAQGVDVVIEVMARPTSSLACRITAEDPNLAPRFASAGDDRELVFALPPDASPAIGCASPELALAITVAGAIETKASVRLADAARIRVSITTSGWQHF